MYCDGIEIVHRDGEPTLHLFDSGLIPEPDVYGVLRCTAAGCLSRDNAGKVWPDHISGVWQLCLSEARRSKDGRYSLTNSAATQ